MKPWVKYTLKTKQHEYLIASGNQQFFAVTYGIIYSASTKVKLTATGCSYYFLAYRPAKFNTWPWCIWLLLCDLRDSYWANFSRVILCQISTKKSLPPPIWTKIGSYTLSVKTSIHSEFQRSILYGFRVRARRKIDF